MHIVWSTKNRKPLLPEAKKNVLCQHIREYAKSKNIHILNINGWNDHLHVLISLKPSQKISEVVQLLKGESAHWFNCNFSDKEKLKWQSSYFAISVSESHFDRVNSYISKQKEHHQRKSFQQEYAKLLNITSRKVSEN